jgi:hypothetical protein
MILSGCGPARPLLRSGYPAAASKSRRIARRS